MKSKYIFISILVTMFLITIVWYLAARPISSSTSTQILKVDQSYLSTIFSLAKQAQHDCKLDNQILQLLSFSSGSLQVITHGEATVPVLDKVPVTLCIKASFEQAHIKIQPHVIDAVHGVAHIFIYKEGKQTRLLVKVTVCPNFSVPTELRPILKQWSQAGANKANNNIIQWMQKTLNK